MDGAYTRGKLRACMGKRLQQAREAIGAGRNDFCQQTGVSSKMLSDYETGKNFPDEYFLFRLYERYGVSPHFIYTGQLAGTESIVADKIQTKSG
jgi:transcriptional regulator with XRE-family HTH domain